MMMPARLDFLRRTFESDIYIGDNQAHGRRLASLRQLTREEAANYPYTWTPDSRAVLFDSNRDGPLRIYKQDVDKDTAELITHGPGIQYGPRVSPDGQWLVYWNWISGDPQARLVRIPLAGGLRRRSSVPAALLVQTSIAVTRPEEVAFSSNYWKRARLSHLSIRSKVADLKS